MNQEHKSKDTLVNQVAALRQRIAELETSEAQLKQAEQRIGHLNAVLRAIRSVNQLITREKDRDRLLQDTCQNLVETRGYYSAWIALLDNSGELITTAQAGLGKDFLPLVEQFENGKLTPCGEKALAQSGLVITENPSSTCRDCPLSTKYAGRGAMTVRLEHGAKIFGLASVSIPRDLATDKEEQSLFQEVVRDIAFALHNLETEEERRQAEEKLKHYSDHLEEMVEERTRKLKEAQEKLIRREKLSVLGQMAGSVGHELRNPLGVISNAAYYLRMTLSEADETTKEYLEMISSEVANSEKIISDLLDLSRTRAAQKEKVTISELISQALEKQPIPQGIEVRREISPQLPYLYVDPRQIEEVLINLIINAYQAMPKGGTLTIKAREKEDKVLILITDTGVGISKENLSKLFDPLYTTKTRGIGLGLSVSQNLTEVNGGEIKVKSKEGEGTTFTLTFPPKKVN